MSGTQRTGTSGGVRCQPNATLGRAGGLGLSAGTLAVLALVGMTATETTTASGDQQRRSGRQELVQFNIVADAGFSPDELDPEYYLGPDGMPSFRVQSSLIGQSPRTARRNGAGERGESTGQCPAELMSTTETNFDGGDPLFAQAGFVEDEVAAVSYELDADEFPIVFRAAEMIFAQVGAIVETTTEYAIQIYQGYPGSPNGFTLVEEFISDGEILPPLIMPPGDQATNVQIVVDATDPDQIVVHDNGSQTFTIGYKVVRHNSPATTSQNCIIADLPPECAPPPSQLNAFPSTEGNEGPPGTSTLDFPGRNWLKAKSNCGQCAIDGGWYSFNQLGSFQPSGDWNIRVTVEKFTCVEESGACCLPDGSCQEVLNTACAELGGVFQGEDTSCEEILCQQPTGACCYEDGGDTICETGMTATQCDALDESRWLGPGTQCGEGACDPPEGACCIPATGACSNRTEDVCVNAIGGHWLGPDTSCETLESSCFGVCCLPDGTCEDNDGNGMLEDDCLAIGGLFVDDATTCAEATCPDPVGACCLTTGACLADETEDECVNLLGGTWGGAGSDCETACEDPVGACCLDNGACLADETEEECGLIGGDWAGEGTDCETSCVPVCEGDSNDDLMVNVTDLLDVITNWGDVEESGTGGAGDVNSDGTVDVSDLLMVINNWGNVCEV